MSAELLAYIAPYLLSGLLSSAISIYSFRRASTTGARAFGFLALFETIWTLGYILQTLNPSLNGKLFWNDVQFLGAVAAPLAFFIFCLSYSQSSWMRARHSAPIAAVLSVSLLALIWTDSFHHLFRQGVHLVPAAQFTRLVFSDGPLFPLYPLIGYPLLFLGAYMLMSSIITAPRVFKLQLATLMIGILIPWVATLVTWMGWVPVTLHDLTPLTFGASSLIVAWALYNFGLLDLNPVAYKTLVERMTDGVIVLDNQGRLLDLNPSAQAILDLNLSGALGTPLPPEHPLAHILGNDPQGTVPARVVTLPVRASPRHYEMKVSLILDHRKAPSGRLVILHDITNWKRAEKKLETMALTDPLTGIYNRRHFFDLAENEFSRSLRTGAFMSLILFDIDHFKSVNDTLGHLCGDQVLHDLAHRCLAVLRPYDVMARYGGEEFIILLPETSCEEAAQIGERLRQSIAGEPFVAGGGQAAVTISLGVACQGQQEVETLNSLVSCADQALYQAKQAGRNRVCLFQSAREGRLPMYKN